MSEYPEHDRLTAIKDQSQAIGEFLEFGPWRLCELGEDDQYWPVRGSIQSTLARYFDIDMDKIEAEKRDMLKRLRWMQSIEPRPITRAVEYPREWSR